MEAVKKNVLSHYKAKALTALFALFTVAATSTAQPHAVLIRPTAVFDGHLLHPGWEVLVQEGRIIAAGPKIITPSEVEIITLLGDTLLPGLIDSHVHLFLHPYSDTSWNEQVLHEPVALRTASAVAAARATLMAGFTTVRDLGTEGAGNADQGLKVAIEQQIVPGPRYLSANRAIVATGSYGPRGYAFDVPQGAEEASGEGVTNAARHQMGEGADVVKLYADYRIYTMTPREKPSANPNASTPTLTVAEMAGAVAVAHDAGRRVAAHAQSAEGMRRAVLAGVDTLEHGDEGTPAIFQLMKSRGTFLCPTLAATEAIARYRGWNGQAPEPPSIIAKRKTLAAAIKAGVKLCAGGDTGVFAHGENAREEELMVEWGGLSPAAVLKIATEGNAEALGLSDRIGRIKPGYAADLIAVAGDPTRDIHALRTIKLVIKNGDIERQ